MTITINGTTGIAGVDGSASVPAFQGNDSDTGIFYPAANTVAAAAGGSTVWNASSTFGFKNRIINGGMVIDQRNAGASVNNSNSNVYILDRWITYGTSAAKFSIQQNAGSVTPPAGFSKYMGFTSLAATTQGASDYYYFGQPIEGQNLADLAWGTASAKTVTLSFWVRSSLTGTFSGVLTNNTARTYPFTFTVNSATTWEQKSITIPGDTTGTWLTTNGVGIYLYFNLGSGSSNLGTAGAWAAGVPVGATGSTALINTNGATFYITGVQLEVGPTATSFDYRPYGTELMLCQRYYENIVAGYAGSAVSGTNNGCMGQFLVEKRAAPTMTWVSTISALNFPTTAPVAYYISGTTKNFWPFKTANGTGQDSRYHDNYTASAEL